MKIYSILQFDVRWIVCFLIAQTWNNTLADPFREECAKRGIFKKKQQDSSLQNHIIEIIEVSHVALCTIACLDHALCKSYNFQETENAVKSCELSSSTQDSSSTDLISRQGYLYYDAQDDAVCEPPCLNGGTCVYSCSGTACQCRNNTYFPDFQGHHCEYPYPASCKMVKESELSQGDGEYDLYLLHPGCSKTARVYCADMNTENPLEYITLPAGRNTNYGFDNRPSGSSYRSYHGKTAYDKIRLQVPSLNVLRGDSRFSVQIEGSSVIIYGRAADCIWRASCANYQNNKLGKAEANLAGTDFKFPSSIPYLVSAWPACANGLLEPTMSADRKKWSVRCGGNCGGCNPDPLVLHVDGC